MRIISHIISLHRGVIDHRQKMRKNSVKLGKNAKKKLKIKEKAEILAQENVQKQGNQLKSAIFHLCITTL